MARPRLTPAERALVHRALVAAARGPYFPDWEFVALFGIERAEVARIAERSPDPGTADRVVQGAIHDAFNNLLGYPHGMEAELERELGVPEQELRRVFDVWRGAPERPRGTLGRWRGAIERWRDSFGR